MNQDVSPQNARLAFSSLLGTDNACLRKQADEWITQTFRPNLKTWEILPRLLWEEGDPHGRIERSEVQFLAAHILYQKLNTDLDQIYHNTSQCVALYKFLLSWCVEKDPQECQGQSNGLRLRMAECLGVAAVSFYGSSWASPLHDIMTAGHPDVDSEDCGRQLQQAIRCLNVVHSLVGIPELLSYIETKSYLMKLMGYDGYIHWRKTKVGLYAQDNVPQVNRYLTRCLTCALRWLRASVDKGNEALISVLQCIIQEGCQAVMRWSRTFKRPLLTFDQQSLEQNVLWDFLLCDAFLTRLPEVPEMLCTLVTCIEIPKTLSRTTKESNGTSTVAPYTTQLVPNDFMESGTLFFPLLALLVKVVSPAFNFLQDDSPMTATPQDIACHGGDALITFAYQWAIVTYNILVVVPTLMTHQNESLYLKLVTEGACSTVVIPPNVFAHLVKLFTRFLPQTHLKMLDIWQDLSDMLNDQVVCKVQVHSWLKQMFPMALRCILLHGHRDNAVWNADDSLRITDDPETRKMYLESAQDVSVTVYYLALGIDAHFGYDILKSIAEFYMNAVNTQDYGTAAVCITLLSSVFESFVESVDKYLLNVLRDIAVMVPSDSECVMAFAILMEKESIYLTEEHCASLWTTAVDILMRELPANPYPCAAAVYALCDAGGHLPFSNDSNSTQFILTFVELIESRCSVLREEEPHFSPLLYGAVACLIRRVPQEAAPELFTRLLSPITSYLDKTLRNMNYGVETVPSVNNDIAASIQRALQAFSSAVPSRSLLTCNFLSTQRDDRLKSDLALVKNMLHISWLARLLLGIPQDSNHPCTPRDTQSLFMGTTGILLTYTEAASYLLQTQLYLDKDLNIALPSKDCFQKQNAQKFLGIATARCQNNLALHILRQFLATIGIYTCYDFAELMLKTLSERHLQNKPLHCIDGSFVYIISDAANQLYQLCTRRDTLNALGGVEWTTVERVKQLWTVCFDTIALPLMISKAQHTDSSQWFRVLKPFFVLVENAVFLWNAMESWAPDRLQYLMAIFVQTLSSPSTKLHRFCWDCISLLLRTKHPTCQEVVLRFYNELIQTFWWYCHWWDLSRAASAAAFMDALLRSTDDPTRTQRFVAYSRSLWDNREASPHSVSKLYNQLSPQDMDFLFQLFPVVQGVRLRQIVMDLIKVAQQLATPDCLLSYQFLLCRTHPSKPSNHVTLSVMWVISADHVARSAHFQHFTTTPTRLITATIPWASMCFVCPLFVSQHTV